MGAVRPATASLAQVLGRGGYLVARPGNNGALLLAGLALGGSTPEAVIDGTTASDVGESWVDGHQAIIVTGRPPMQSAEYRIGTRSAARVTGLTLWIGVKDHLVYMIQAKLMPAPRSPDTVTETLTWKSVAP